MIEFFFHVDVVEISPDMLCSACKKSIKSVHVMLLVFVLLALYRAHFFLEKI